MTAKIEHPMLKSSVGTGQTRAGGNSGPTGPTGATMFSKKVEDKSGGPDATAVDSVIASSKDPFSDPVMKQEIEKRKTLEKLLLFKKPITKSIELDGSIFKFKLLNSNDSAEVFTIMADFNDVEQQIKVSLLLLSASLYEVDGVSLETAYDGPVEVQSDIVKRYHEISKWNAPLVNALTREYRKFVDDEEKRYSPDFLAK